MYVYRTTRDPSPRNSRAKGGLEGEAPVQTYDTATDYCNTVDNHARTALSDEAVLVVACGDEVVVSIARVTRVPLRPAEQSGSHDWRAPRAHPQLPADMHALRRFWLWGWWWVSKDF